MRTNDGLATVLLASRLVSDGLTPLKASEFWPLIDSVGKPGALLGESEEQLVRSHGLAADIATRVVSLLERATALAFELDRLEQSGIGTLTPFDDGYPSRLVVRLQKKAPPVLHVAGNVGLFARPGLGVVGSRDIGEQGAEVARAAAELATRVGAPLVSGGARGVDQLAMNASYASGGSVVGFLADSMARTLRTADVRRAIFDDNTLLCTPYGPDAPFNAGNAMGRNKLIYVQSLVTLVVASDLESGGTWAGAIEALKGQFGRVAVWRGGGEGPGNAAIESRRAIPVTSVDELEALVQADEPSIARPADNPTVQASLFD